MDTTIEQVTTARAIPADTFAARLMLARAHAGHLSIRQAADKCGIGRGAWTNWERGARPVGEGQIAEIISERLGVDRDWLLWGGELAPEDRRPGRKLERRKQPTAHYPIGADHRPHTTTRPTPPSSARPISALNHTAATHTSSRPGRRTRRIDRSAHGE